MPLTRLANSIIDGVAERPGRSPPRWPNISASDLLFYRADSSGRTRRAAGAQHWDPILDWARDALGARFVCTARRDATWLSRETALDAARAAIPDNPWRLGAVHVGDDADRLGADRARAGARPIAADAAWAAAHVDEDWNMEQWGRDELALERRAYRFAELQAAATVLAALSG